LEVSRGVLGLKREERVELVREGEGRVKKREEEGKEVES
jgi:hypothetical protein